MTNANTTPVAVDSLNPGETYSRQQGSTVYARLSAAEAAERGLGSDRVWGLAVNGTVYGLRPSTHVHRASVATPNRTTRSKVCVCCEQMRPIRMGDLCDDCTTDKEWERECEENGMGVA